MPHMCRGASPEPPLGAVRPLCNLQLIRINLPVALHARQREALLRQRGQRKDLLQQYSAAVRILVLQRKADKTGHTVCIAISSICISGKAASAQQHCSQNSCVRAFGRGCLDQRAAGDASDSPYLQDLLQMLSLQERCLLVTDRVWGGRGIAPVQTQSGQCEGSATAEAGGQGFPGQRRPGDETGFPLVLQMRALRVPSSDISGCSTACESSRQQMRAGVGGQGSPGRRRPGCATGSP